MADGEQAHTLIERASAAVNKKIEDIAHTLAHARGATRDDRAREALRQMGDSVFKGGISTFFGICITGFAKSYIFWCFFKFLASIIAYAQFFGMVVMPVMLSLVGPMAPHATAPVAPA